MIPRSLTIGNFDGVHLGHQRLIDKVLEVADENGWRPAAITFHPHPIQILAPERAPQLLMPIDERISQMKQYGIEEVICLPFSKEMALLTPAQFAEQILAQQCGARAVIVGDNFRFGNRQAGDVKTLRDLGQRLNFITNVVGAVTSRGQIASSSCIRKLLRAGEVSKACRLLNRPFSIHGPIVSGHGIGSKQTVPTLNLETKTEVLPANGVYVTSAILPGACTATPSITNIGMRPTFGGDKLTIETFLLDGISTQPDSITLRFHRGIREERLFPSPETLKAQIMKDVERARAYWRHYEALTL